MKILDNIKSIGLVVVIAAMAGNEVLTSFELNRNADFHAERRKAEADIKDLINQRHIETIDRITRDSIEQVLAFKDSERVCAAAQATIETTTYFKGKSIHGC